MQIHASTAREAISTNRICLNRLTLQSKLTYNNIVDILILFDRIDALAQQTLLTTRTGV